MDEDRQAIEALIFGYAEQIDLGNFDAVGALFEDATYRSSDGGCFSGSAEVAALFSAGVRRYDGTPCTKHVTTNVVVAFEDGAEAARATSYFTVLQALEDFPLQTIAAGRYHDRFERRDGLWRFLDRLVYLDLTGDLSRHLAFSV